MSDFEFDLPAERFSHDLADEGVWHHPKDENGTSYGEFKCRLADTDSQRYRASVERYKKTHKHRTRDMDESEKLVDQFIHLILVDWRGINAKGKPVPFSKEAAYKLLTHDRYIHNIFPHIYARSHDVAFYQGNEEEDEAGN